MKLASMRDSARDGRLAVVSDDLTRFSDAAAIAPTLQAALEEWDRAAPLLEALWRDVEIEGAPTERFHERAALSPLPRAYQWADGAAYLNNVELVRRARGAPMPDRLRTEPLIYQGGADAFLAPRDPIPLADERWGLDVEGEVAVIVGDVAQGATPAQAAAAIRLVLLVNDVSLRGLIADELEKGFGFFQSKPASSFSPVAVTPAALGPAWDGGRLHGVLRVDVNGQALGRVETGRDMSFDFPALIAHAARTRSLAAGSVIGAGAASNRAGDGGPAAPVAEGGAGYACLIEARMVETLRHGAPRTPWLRRGDTVRIEMRDGRGRSVFGAIEQEVGPAS